MKKLALLFILALLSVSITTAVSAQSVIPIQVAPARQEILANPGEKTNFTIRFYNFDENPVAGDIKAADFLVQSSTGRPRIIDNPAQASPKFSGSQWITIPYDTMTIAARDKVTVQGSITVPSDARPGGRYVAIYFQPSGSQVPNTGASETAINVSPRLVGLLYIRVAGDITEQASILSFVTPVFSEYGPIEISTLILNNGDYHINPKGVLTLENTLTHSVSQSILKEQNIFPGASLLYKNSIGKHLMIGRYKLTLQAAYGETGQALSRSMYLWVFPWRIAIAIILGLILVMLLIRKIMTSLSGKTNQLAQELTEEKTQIEQLKEQLRRTREK